MDYRITQQTAFLMAEEFAASQELTLGPDRKPAKYLGKQPRSSEIHLVVTFL